MILTISALEQLVEQALRRNGCTDHVAQIMAATLCAAERDGAGNHGIMRLPGYVSSLRCGWVDGAADPVIEAGRPGIVAVDGRNGFAQVALDLARPQFIDRVRAQGIALLAIRNAHHPAALWVDLEAIALAGLVVLGFVNTRSFIVPPGGSRPLYGTNPMGFACPRREGPPMVWDQASSVMSRGEIIVAAREGRTLAHNAGYDGAGQPTNDPAVILRSGALAPLGGYKGANIAMMVELLAGALTGALFGYEDQAARHPGAWTVNAGQCYVAIDPRASTGERFFDRVEELFERITDDPGVRLPARRRYENRRRALVDGVEIDAVEYQSLLAFATGDDPNQAPAR